MNLEVAKKSDLKKNVYLQLSLILLIGFLLRIYLSTLITYEGDFSAWQGWGRALSNDGFHNFTIETGVIICPAIYISYGYLTNSIQRCRGFLCIFFLNFRQISPILVFPY